MRPPVSASSFVTRQAQAESASNAAARVCDIALLSGLTSSWAELLGCKGQLNCFCKLQQDVAAWQRTVRRGRLYTPTARLAATHSI